jgi:hypothetical protein
MALKRFVCDGFGQLELNQVAFRRDGRIEAQCALSPVDFAEVPAENGMLLAVDNINRVIKYPVSGEKFPVALNYTTEHMYDERAKALKNFNLARNSFLPRLGYLSVGDKFTTNCLCYDDAEFTDDAALEAAYNPEALKKAPLYGGVSTMGAIKVSKTAPTEGPVLMAVLGTGAGSMPDGQFGMKFQVVAA